MGDKTAARRAAEACGVPTVPGTGKRMRERERDCCGLFSFRQGSRDVFFFFFDDKKKLTF